MLCLTVTSAWAIDSGSCGTGVVYNYDDYDHILYIINSGSGAMADYASENDQPWKEYRSDITSIQILGATSIGKNAFSGCTGLTSIVIPPSVTSIGESAFNNCTGLTSITFDSGSHLSSIGNFAFSKCNNPNLTSIEIPSGVTSIGESAFSECTGLTSIVIPSGVTSIGESAFLKCSGLSSVTFASGSNLASIGNLTFSECTGLMSISIPAKVGSIGDKAFYKCSSLTSITFASGSQLASIATYAFYYCSSLQSIEIPASVTSIGISAFYDCTNLTSIAVADGNANYSSDNGVLFNNNKTTLIRFPEGKTADPYTIPASVTSIGDYSFYHCSKLTSIEIPTSVTSIGDAAFFYCPGLTSIAFTSGSQLTSIGKSAFRYCNNAKLTTIEIPASVTSIGNDAFSGCTGLTSIVIHATSLQTCGNGAFDNNKAGRKLYVPSASVNTYKTGWSGYANDITGFDEIGTCGATGNESSVIWTLTGTSSNYALTIGGTGTMADNSSSNLGWYGNRDNIQSVVIEDGVTSIGSSAFSDCTNLTSVTLNSNPIIGTNAFPSGATVTMNLTGNEGKTGEYWMTFYNENYGFTADGNTTIYKAAVNGTNTAVVLTEVADIPKNNAAVLKSSNAAITMTLATSASADYTGNELLGTDADLVNPGNAYCLNKNASNEVGFYKFTDSGTIPANRAYLVISPSLARAFYGFDVDEDPKTAIQAVKTVSDEGEVYDLSGRRVVGQPRKGIYVRNGKKFVIK